MYKFCIEHDLREVWAYVWESWYRKSHWELWARSAHPEIPALKTTMILESHWRRIKHNFLHHFHTCQHCFHMPHCDLLAWILITKLTPCYYQKLEQLLADTGRYREVSSWRRAFKATWKKLKRKPMTLPVNPAYKTDAKKNICTCPSLPVSRFLLCKHVVQGHKPVPSVFFLEVERQRTAPFWIHPSLWPVSDEDSAQDRTSEDVGGELRGGEAAGEPSTEWDDEDDEDLVDTWLHDDSWTFEETMDDNTDLILEFAKGLKYQCQFCDQRMLQVLEREGASFLRLAWAWVGKEKRLQSTHGTTPSAWDRSGASAMFYHAQPPASENVL
ncbi:hypothetical protein B0H14DRAFT_2346627 [Mycena olivaceomarginata]|nr:hypothetical protein B0H14DRAFT_2346627 [Mycena olivaceomarginata]